ncbi:hypothetical protein SCYAM73S_03293 [Streptomyces cyaneofuscatus]
MPPCLARETDGASLVSVTLDSRTGCGGAGVGGAGGAGGATWSVGAGAGGVSGTGVGAGGVGGTGAGAAGLAGAGAAACCGSSTEMPKSVARPSSPLLYPCPTARNFQAPWRRYSSPRMNAVSIVASVESKRASSAPPAASTTRTYSPLTRPKVPPSAEAATMMRSIAGSTLPKSTSRVSVTPSPAVRLPSWRTAPEAWAGWL